MAGRLLVWLGGIALVLAAIFLIRYSIEIGLMTPAARMTGAAIFGFALLGAAELARHALSATTSASPRPWPAPGSRPSMPCLMEAMRSII